MTEYFRRLRAIVGNELLLLPATACIVLNERGEILLQCRVDNRMWSCPGGILDVGETVMENVVREVREETGLSIEAPLLFGIFSGRDFFFTYPNGDETAILQCVFLTRSYSGELASDAESHEVRFFPVSSLPSPITSTHLGFLRYLPDVLAGRMGVPIVK